MPRPAPAPNVLAGIPRVDHVLATAALAEHPWRRAIKKRVVTDELARVRGAVVSGTTPEPPNTAAVAAAALARLRAWERPSPRPLINATGVLLHTNLGRAPLATDAVAAVVGASGACDLEIDPGTGLRRSRLGALTELLAAILGSEATFVCNNNAAAVLLACTALAGPGPIALSRGQMVEIGDGFRVADMVSAAGCRIEPVGSTNRTHREDYVTALTGATGTPATAVLWVHPSNFVQHGFVAEVSLPELVALAREHGVPLIADLGSGSLGAGLPPGEPTIFEHLERGVDLVLVSADKLLAGPQAGILAGRADLVERCRRHPLARALRLDKLAVAGLHATACAHASEGTPQLPLHQMVAASTDALRRRARLLVTACGWRDADVVDTEATIGGGSLPGEVLASVGVRLRCPDPDRLARRLRLGEPSVVARIERGAVVVDLRSVPDEADASLARAIADAQR